MIVTMKNRLRFSGDLATTAMGILPHDSVDAALDLSLSLDIPFWPHLPNLSFYEDMYVQAMANFPGILIDPEKQTIYVDTRKFMDDLPVYLVKWRQVPLRSHIL